MRVLPCNAIVVVEHSIDMGIFIGVSLGRKYRHNAHDSQEADHHGSQHHEGDDLFYCKVCKKEYPSTYLFDTEGVPNCDCGGLIRPDIVLYGEMLPQAYYDAADIIAEADVLIVAGTSLQVSTAGALVEEVQGEHLVILNDTPTPYDDLAELIIREPLGGIFGNLSI